MHSSVGGLPRFCLSDYRAAGSESLEAHPALGEGKN